MTMPDFDNMSEKELAEWEAKLGPSKSNTMPDFDNMSEKELAMWEDKLGIEEHVIQKQHPDVDHWARFKIKNFATDPFEALKAEMPNHDVSKAADGQLLIKRKNERDWQVLDPDTGALSSDIVGDVLDVGYDIAAGVGTGAATALGGLAGNLPGAIAAGGASSGAAEYLRQELGQRLLGGQEYDPEQIAMQTGFGAVGPMLLGSGANVGKALSKAAAGKGGLAGKFASSRVAVDGMEKLAEGQRGLLGKAYDLQAGMKYGTGAIGRKMGRGFAKLGAMKGTTADIIMDNEKFKYLNKLKDVDTEFANFVDKAGEDAVGAFKSATDDAWDDIVEGYGDATIKNKSINSGKIIKIYEDEIAELSKKAVNADDRQAIAMLKQDLESFRPTELVDETVEQQVPSSILDASGKPVMTTKQVTQKVPKTVETMSPLDAANKLRQHTRERAELWRLDKADSAYSAADSAYHKHRKRIGARMNEALTDELKSKLDSTSTVGKKALAGLDRFAKLKDLERRLGKFKGGGSQQAFANRLRNIGFDTNAYNSSDLERMMEAVPEIGNLKEAGKMMQAHRDMGAGDSASVFTATGNLMKQAPGVMAGGALGSVIGNKVIGDMGAAGYTAGAMSGWALFRNKSVKNVLRGGMRSRKAAEGMARTVQRADGTWLKVPVNILTDRDEDDNTPKR